MHDIGSTRFETSPQNEQLEGETFEYQEVLTNEGESTPVFNEIQELELASEFLEVSSEQELDRFIGSLMSSAGRAVGTAVRSPAVRQVIGSALKGAAKSALPAIGSVVGGYLGGDTGATWGQRIGSAAGSLFGLELEGLSGEDQEFEIARRFVQFGGQAVKNMAATPPSRPPQEAARSAVLAAARTHAPGLLRRACACGPRPVGPRPATPLQGHAPTQGGGLRSDGRWTRQGRTIVLHGL